VIAASVDTRVRVDLLANVMAIVWPLREVDRDNGVSPDLIASLCERAFWTSVVNSSGVRSAIDRRWRGANGEV
jgi:hypothetical protein